MRSTRRFADRITRFDLRTLLAVSVGCVALCMVARFDGRLIIPLAGPLVVLWLLCLMWQGVALRRRVRGLWSALAGALAGVLLGLGVQAFVWELIPHSTLLSVSLSMVGTALGGLVGLAGRRTRRRLRRYAFLGVGAR